MKSEKYSKVELLIIIALISSMVVQELIGINYNSMIYDERCFVGAGRAIFETGNMRSIALVNHPPLSYYIGSLLLMPLKIDDSIWQSDDCWEVGKNVVFHSGHNPNKILFLSRLPFVFLSIALALYVLKWASELYGKKSGLVALFLYSFNPSIIAYSGAMLTDFTVAMIIFISVYYFWKLVKEPSKKHLVLSGMFLGLALLSKTTAILLIFILFVLGIFAFYQKKYNLNIKILAKNLFIMLLISFVLIFAFYGFQFEALSKSLPEGHYSEKARGELSKFPYFSKQLLYFYDNVPLPASSYFGEIGNIIYLSTQQPTNGYVFGKVTKEVLWYFVYVTFFLKTGIPVLIFLLFLFLFRRKIPDMRVSGRMRKLAFARLATRTRSQLTADFFTKACLWAPIIVMFINFSVTNKMSGVKHLLPVYPFIFVLASNAINAKFKRQKFYSFIVLFLLAYYAISAILIAPHYLSYINELGLGPNNAHKIVVGSNIDLGQDLKGLKDYMEKNKLQKIKLSYFGSADPNDYGISYEYLPSPYFQQWVPDYTFLQLNERKENCSETKGIIAISVTNLKNVHLLNKTCFNWLDKYDPIDKIGYSIFIYNLTNAKEPEKAYK